MMIGTKRVQGLFEKLPRVRGELRANVPLARYTWFRVGGPAEVLFTPADRDDLLKFLQGSPENTPLTVIGLGSNVLVRDGGIPGVVIRLVRGLSAIKIDGSEIIVGAGALDLKVSRTAAAAGIGGLEFLSGVPGSIGGAVRMNAGAYGQEVADVLVSAVVINRRGLSRERVADEFRFTYRTSNLEKDDIVVEARLRGFMDTSARIAKRMGHLEKTRSESQPTRERTGGSTFINPPQDTAWRLIENAGCRDLRRGGAAISKKHCNFLVNNGHATAADLEGLGEEVRRRVFYETGVRLAWEIRRLGCHGPTLANVGA